MLHPLRPRVAHPTHGGLYQFHRGDVFTPGAQTEVFEPRYTLPFIAVQGHGVFCGSSPSPRQAPQVWAGNPVPTRGLGGLVHGTLYTQNLMLNPDSENG